VQALVPALADWFTHGDYRGCAFINAVGELGGTLPEVARIAREHKQAMTRVIARLLPAGARRRADAQVLALAVDGAIVQAQMGDSPAQALKALRRLVASVQSGGQAERPAGSG
jgi:AcrR family transcriptional regulator